MLTGTYSIKTEKTKFWDELTRLVSEITYKIITYVDHLCHAPFIFCFQASDLYEKLFSSHMTELSPEHSDWCIRWQPCWIDPVLEVLCGSNKLQKKHVIEVKLIKDKITVGSCKLEKYHVD